MDTKLLEKAANDKDFNTLIIARSEIHHEIKKSLLMLVENAQQIHKIIPLLDFPGTRKQIPTYTNAIINELNFYQELCIQSKYVNDCLQLCRTLMQKKQLINNEQ
jgi:hypothetical protein